MKTIRKLIIVGSVISFLALAIPGSYLLLPSVFASNISHSKRVLVEYRITSSEANLETTVDIKAGHEPLKSQKVALPWSSKQEKDLDKGEPIALYFSTYNNKHTTVTYEIFVDGVKVASQTEDGENFISNNISYNYN